MAGVWRMAWAAGLAISVAACASGTEDRDGDEDAGERFDGGGPGDAGHDGGPPPVDAPPGVDVPPPPPVDAGPPDTGPADAGPMCGPGRGLCDGACVLLSDPRTCGGCDNDCTALPGVDPARVRCFAGACRVV